jgi:hypothetical protein
VLAAAHRHAGISRVALAAGALYLAMVLATALVGSRFGKGILAGNFWRWLALANGVGGAVAALLGLWYVSANTAVLTATGRDFYPWLPGWLVLAGVAGVLGWSWWRLRGGRLARGLERTLLVTVVGAALLFLAVSRLPGPASGLVGGFDDAQDITGASFLARGMFPWRDFVFIHGLWLDALRGSVGVAVFGDSIWGAAAAAVVLLLPLCVVVVYLFAAWLTRGNPWFAALVGLGFVGGVVPLVDIRFTLVPVTCIMIAATLRRPGRARTTPLWTVGLTLLLFVQAVLVPETSFLAAPALACVVAADVLHAEPGDGWWARLRRTRWCAATGALALGAFVGFLAWNGAFGAWLDYYTINGVSHNEVGAIPPTAPTVRPRDVVLFATAVLAALLTFAATVRRVRARADWRPQDWMAVAAAAFVALYAEKTLGRLDSSHIWQTYGAALPLTLFWLWRGMSAADNAVARAVRAVKTVPSWTTRAVTPALLLLVMLPYSPALPSLAVDVPQAHLIVGELDPRYPRMGYLVPGWVDTTMIDDLDRVLRAFAGPDGAVFDNTNSLGYVYYLLGRVPGTRFEHVSLAVTPNAQQLLIDELRRSRPPVVIFDSTSMGVPAWDGIPNNVRHYDLSQYLLDNWVPVLRTHGNLILVRRDLALAGDARPGASMPALAEPPVTTDLWFSRSSCYWGTSAAYLPSIPAGEPRQVPVTTLGIRKVITVTGWAADPVSGRPATVVGVAGSQVVGTATSSLPWPDVAAAAGTAPDVGFRFFGLADPPAVVSFYLLGEDGLAYPLAGSPPSDLALLTLPDGRLVPTTTTTAGRLEADTSVIRLVHQIDPTGLRLADYALATFSAGASGLGDARLTITDAPGLPGHDIYAGAVPWANPVLPIRVGSCLQWRGYDSSRPLYVLQDQGNPVSSLTLSQVRAR